MLSTSFDDLNDLHTPWHRVREPAVSSDHGESTILSLVCFKQPSEKLLRRSHYGDGDARNRGRNPSIMFINTGIAIAVVASMQQLPR